MIFMVKVAKSDLENGQKIKVSEEIPDFDKGYDRLLFYENEGDIYAFTDTFGGCVETPDVCNAFSDEELGFHEGDRDWIQKCIKEEKFLFFIDWDTPMFFDKDKSLNG